MLGGWSPCVPPVCWLPGPCLAGPDEQQGQPLDPREGHLVRPGSLLLCCPTGGLLWFWMEGCGLSGLAFSAAVIPGPVLGQPQGAGGQGAAASCRAVSAQLPSFFLQLSPQLCHPLFCGCV